MRSVRRLLSQWLIVLIALIITAGTLAILPGQVAIGQVSDLCTGTPSDIVVVMGGELRAGAPGHSVTFDDYDATIRSGTYRVTLITDDPSHDAEPIDAQDMEQWQVVLLDAAGTEVGASGFTSDFTGTAATTDVFDSVVVSGNAATVRAVHLRDDLATTPLGGNETDSVWAQCAIFDLVGAGMAAEIQPSAQIVDAGDDARFEVNVTNTGDTDITGLATSWDTPNTVCQSFEPAVIGPGMASQAMCTTTGVHTQPGNQPWLLSGEIIADGGLAAAVSGTVGVVDVAVTGDTAVLVDQGGDATVVITITNNGSVELESPSVADSRCNAFPEGTIPAGSELSTTCVLTGVETGSTFETDVLWSDGEEMTSARHTTEVLVADLEIADGSIIEVTSQTADFDVVLQNTGEVPLRDIVELVIDSIPAAEVSCTSPAGVTLEPGEDLSIACTIMGVTDRVDLDLTASATAFSDQYDLQLAVGAMAARVAVPDGLPVISIESFTASPAVVSASTTVTFEVIVAYSGPWASIDVIVEDPAAECGQTDLDVTAGQYVRECSATVTKDVTVEVIADAVAADGGRQLVRDDVTVDVRDDATIDLELVVAAEPIQFNVGGVSTVTVTVTNRGPDTATGVDLAFNLPSNVRFVAADEPGVTATGGPLADIMAGDSETVTLTVEGLTSGAGALSVEVAAADGLDADSTPGDGTGDDHDSIGLIVTSGPTRPGTISGCVFLDGDGDGTVDAGETLIDGVRVFSGSADDVTSGPGYSLSVAAGTQRVAVDVDTLPEPYDFTTPATRLVTVGAGREISGVCFGVIAPGPYTMTLSADPSEIEIDKMSTMTILVEGPSRPDVPVVFGPLPEGLELEGPSRLEVPIGRAVQAQVTGREHGSYVISARAETNGSTGPVASAAIVVTLPANQFGGWVFVDLDGDGTREPGEPPPSNASQLTVEVTPKGIVASPSAASSLLSGLYGPAPVRISSVALGWFLAADPIIVGVDAFGRYESPPLPAGGYQLEIVDPSGQQVTSRPEAWQLTLPREAGNQGLDFAIAPTESIQGLVWLDEDRSGWPRDQDELGMPHVTVTISDLDGRFEPQSLVTSGDAGGSEAAGSFSAIVGPGDYYVTVGGQEGGLSFSTPHPIEVQVLAGVSYTEVDFGVTNASAAISGRVWCDINNNDTLDNDEISYAGVVTLSGPVGPRTDELDADGNYEFTGLPPGEYRLELSATDNVVDGNSAPILTDEIVVSLQDGDIKDNVDFEPCPQGSIGGAIYLDENDNGRRDDDDKGVDGVRVELRQDGTLISDWPTDTSSGPGDAIAQYRFQHLAPGVYTVAVVLDGVGDIGDITLITPAESPVLVPPDTSVEIVHDIRFESSGWPIPLWFWVLIIGIAILIYMEYRLRRLAVPVPIPIPPPEPTVRGPGPNDLPQPLPPSPARRPKRTPYRGPRPFRRIDAPIFGRDEESRALESLTYSSRILIVYGPSGAGKTSLLNAGYIPVLDRTKFEVLPVTRFQLGPEPPDIENAFTYAVLSYLEASVSPNATSFRDYLKQHEPKRNDLGLERARVIVVDEFQEMFRLPPTMPDVYKNSAGERQAFFDEVAEALESDQWARFVLCIDEDEMGELEPLIERFAPHVIAEYRVEPLLPEQAREAVTGPASAKGRAVDKAAVDKLIACARTFRAEHGGHPIEVKFEHVDLMTLQIAAEQAWQSATGEGIEAADVLGWDDQDSALMAFYDSTLAELSRATPEAELRAWCERALISPTGTRKVLVAEAVKAASISEHDIQYLVERGMLTEAVRGELTWYELSHERLVAAIRDSNRAWREQTLITATSSFLAAASKDWDRSGRAEGLLTGQLLVDAMTWANLFPSSVGPLERAFLEASSNAPLGRA